MAEDDDNDDEDEHRSTITYEQHHVHAVYDRIASHFSSTRHKPWPLVSAFLQSQPPGSIGLDIGCGNGKYLSSNASVFTLASDRSRALLDIARAVPAARIHADALQADALALPHPDARFDFAVAVAVVHHLSTRPRRVAAVREVLGVLRVEQGRALVYVWALEQRGSRRGWGEGDEQDVMVPWVLKDGAKGGGGEVKRGEEGDDGGGEQDGGRVVLQRYYHLYRAGELEEDIRDAGGEVVDSGYEKDNWWAIARRKR